MSLPKILIISTLLLLLPFTSTALPVHAQVSPQLSIEKYYFKKAPIQYGQNRLYVIIQSPIDYDNTVTVSYTINGKTIEIIKDRHITIIENDHVGVFTDISLEQSGELTLTIATPNNTSVTAIEKTQIPADSDKDSLPNTMDSDDDNDGLSDDDEKRHGTSETDPDSDDDGIFDMQDYFPLDNAESLDTDSDGLGNAKDLDDDNDGLTDIEELHMGTNTLLKDTDGDSLNDSQEVIKKTNPLLPDTDNDGSGDNIDIAPLDPTSSSDSDGDGIADDVELKTGLDPTNGSDTLQDSDNDGITNKAEVLELKTNPLLGDTDNDGIPDKFEVTWGLNPNNATDAQLDKDGDSISNKDEYQAHLNPNSTNSYLIPDKTVITLKNRWYIPLSLAIFGIVLIKRKKK